MAAIAQRRTSTTELGGRNDSHKLLPDTYQNTNTARRHSEQRPSADGVAGERTMGETGAPGSNQSSSNTATEANDEDGTAGPTDDHEDDDEEAEVPAPSRGYGKGKGKRPSIRFEATGDDESASDDDETTSREAGLTSSKHPVAQLRNHNKKRTYSNLSNSSLLFGEESAFPRPKALRTLSHTVETGLLTYHGANADGSRGDDNAIESSDDEGDNLATTEDDDEDYSALNQILDDDTDVEKVEEEEESFILHQETNNNADIFSMPFSDLRRSSLDTLGSGDLFDLNEGIATDGNGAFFTSVGMPDAGFGHFFSEAAPASPEPIAKRKFSDALTKRVRFQDHPDPSDSSDSSESELDDTLFPDLFLEQDKLPRSVHQLMEIDESQSDEDFNDGASDQFFWNADHEKFDDDESEAGSSGYETDEGDTTDDCAEFGESDDEPGSRPHTSKEKTILSRPASAPSSRAATPKPFQRSAPGPTRGTFIHDDANQAIAVTDRRTKKVTFYRPRVTMPAPYSAYSSAASTANNSPRSAAAQLDMSAFTFDPFLNLGFNTDPAHMSFDMDAPVGPLEAFFPFVSVQDGMVVSDEGEFDDDDLVFENDINIADFMDFGSDIDDATDIEDNEEGDETDAPATPATSMVFNGSTPARPTPAAETPLARKHNSTDAMLQRLDQAGVTAFRNNQSRFRDIACLPHDPNLRASASRPVRSGRSADTMMSPIRKRSSKKQNNSAFSRVSKNRMQAVNSRKAPVMGTFS